MKNNFYSNHRYISDKIYKKLLIVGFWILILLLCLINSAFLFNTPTFSLASIFYALYIFVVVIINHHLFISYGIGFIRNRKWLFFALLLLLLYVISSSSIFILEITANYFPEFGRIQAQSERYRIRLFKDLFSLTSFAWILTNILVPNILAALLELFRINYESNIRNSMLLKLNTELELNFLRAQINPHFLFNTLNNIYGLVMDNEQASKIILKLSDLLRFSLYESNSGFITLDREVEFLIDYISLEEIRHNNKVSIQYSFEEINAKNAKIAPLLLINFIENAFKHGVNSTIQQSWVNIKLKQECGVITFTISNSKPRSLISEERFIEGIGLSNVKRRLDLIYPMSHELLIKNTIDTFNVTLKINCYE
jgi:two-component system, LytTR family, sensor kinase